MCLSWPHLHVSLIAPSLCIPHGPVIVYPPYGLSLHTLFKVSILHPLGFFFVLAFSPYSDQFHTTSKGLSDAGLTAAIMHDLVTDEMVFCTFVHLASLDQ
jgi:hypothetical protein